MFFLQSLALCIKTHCIDIPVASLARLDQCLLPIAAVGVIMVSRPSISDALPLYIRTFHCSDRKVVVPVVAIILGDLDKSLILRCIC
jgi:hypothetical protein